MKDIEIDTALIGEVLGRDVLLWKSETESNHIPSNHIMYVYWTDKEKTRTKTDILNLDTLTRLMKEWCYKQDEVITSQMYGINEYDTTLYNRHEIFEGKSELEAVYKATEYVYEQVKGK